MVFIIMIIVIIVVMVIIAVMITVVIITIRSAIIGTVVSMSTSCPLRHREEMIRQVVPGAL
jgi:hypothetical protein